jgi:hypothetical protein
LNGVGSERVMLGRCGFSGAESEGAISIGEDEDEDDSDDLSYGDGAYAHDESS